ncbi:MAG TPA: MurT ligase domain-containing protein [Acidimicrobiales bacterium]
MAGPGRTPPGDGTGSPAGDGHVLVRLRGAAAVGATRALNALSRRLGLGGGTVAGGRIGLVIDPSILARLARDRRVVLVSGTNGKTTTTALLARALAASGTGVVTNATGANMPAGHLASLVGGPRGAPAVLEVDEAYLGRQVAELRPEMVVLLNLSRDQLDRTNEVRMLAERWRGALESAPGVRVVANADDPLVVFGAAGRPGNLWVSAGGLGWRHDATGCPACSGRIAFATDRPGPGAAPGVSSSPPVAGGWHCTSCALARPPAHAWLETTDGRTAVAWADGRRRALQLELPGRFNQANALIAVVAAEALDVDAGDALSAVAGLSEVAGRFALRSFGPVRVRLLLAKNPAGWTELLDLVGGGDEPIVVAINARVADGRDPSWLWDVPFEVLAGRRVVASGDRASDLSVRLHYAGVEHRTVPDVGAAVGAAGGPGWGGDCADRDTRPGPDGRLPTVQFVGNYTAFHDLLGRR